MKSMYKTISYFLFVFLIINIVCVACPFKKLYSGQTSRSKDNAEEESDVLKECKMILFLEFKNTTGLENFLHAFLNLNEGRFLGSEKLDDLIHEYYYDLVYTTQDTGLPSLLTPQQYCLKKNKSKAEECIRNIGEFGCEANITGILCVEKLYLRWKKKEESALIPVSGTENLSDEDLMYVVSRGVACFSNLAEVDLLKRLSDEMLLEDFYRENEDRRINKDDLEYAFEMGVNYRVIGRQLKEYGRQNKIDLFEARFRVYGNGDLPYSDLYKEYDRRQYLAMPFVNSYATYLHDKMKKKWDETKFKNRKKYCEWYLDQHNNTLPL